MSEIFVQKEGEKWVATHEGRRIAASSCRNCVVSSLLTVTKKSTKYNKIVVIGLNGLVEKTLPTGAGI